MYREGRKIVKNEFLYNFRKEHFSEIMGSLKSDYRGLLLNLVIF